MTVELNKPVTVTTANAKSSLEAILKQGFNTISNGLGLADGKYKFTTASEDFLGFMPVETRAKKEKLVLTFIKGVANGMGEQEGITKKFEDRNICVIPSSSWGSVTPNTDYVITVSNNYVTSIELLNSGEATEDVSEDKPKKKDKKSKEKDAAE